MVGMDKAQLTQDLQEKERIFYFRAVLGNKKRKRYFLIGMTDLFRMPQMDADVSDPQQHDRCQ